MSREIAKVVEGSDGCHYLMVFNWPCGEAEEPLEILGLKEGSDQINKAFLARSDDALEMAAKICEERANDWRQENTKTCITGYRKKLAWDKAHEADECAKAIRALKGQAEP